MNDERLMYIYGEDIYRALYSVFLFQDAGTDEIRDIIREIEADKEKIFSKIAAWYEDIGKKLIERNIIDEKTDVKRTASYILVNVLNEIGIYKTYDFMKMFYEEKLIKSGNKEHETDEEFDILKNFDEIDDRLECLYTAMEIGEESITLKQAYDIISTKFTKNCIRQNRNTMLHIIGDYVLNFMASEYILNRYVGLEVGELLYIKGLTLNENIISNKFRYEVFDWQEVVTKDMLALGDMEREMNIISACHKMYIFKSTMACLFMNMVERNNMSFKSICNRLFREYANISFDKPQLSSKQYMEFLCYFAETNGLEFEFFEKKTKKKDICSIQVRNTRRNLNKIFIIRLINVKESNLPRDIIRKLHEKWRKEWLLSNEFNVYLRGAEGKILDYSPKEDTSHIYSWRFPYFPITDVAPDEEMNSIRNEHLEQKDYEQLKELSAYEVSKKKEVNSQNKVDTFNADVIQDFSESTNILYIMRSTSNCMRKKHNVIAATGALVNLKRRTVKININYCTECKRLFIYYDDFKRYSDLYGPLLGNYSLKYMRYDKQEDIRLADESPLHVCGYNVNQQMGYTETERQRILANIMDYDIMKKPNIITYLHFFIKNNGKKRNMKIAVSKWESDLDFVNKYKINQQKRYKINQVK